MDFPEDTASIFPCDATISRTSPVPFLLNAIGFSLHLDLHESFFQFHDLSLRWACLWRTSLTLHEMDKLRDNSLQSLQCLLTVSYFASSHHSSSSLLSISVSWYLLPFSLTKYLTTCYLASYSALISWSSVSTSLQCTHDTNADFTCFAYKLLYVRLLLQISLWCTLYLLTDLDTPGLDILNISTTFLSWNNISFQLLLSWADHVANRNFYPSAEPIKTSSNQWLTPPGIRLYISLMHQSLYNLSGSTWIK